MTRIIHGILSEQERSGTAKNCISDEGTGKTDPWIKAFDVKPDNMSSVPRNHIVSPQAVCCPPHEHCIIPLPQDK